MGVFRSVCACVCVSFGVCAGTYELSCLRNPLVVNVTHNLSMPFFKTAALLLNFSTVHVAVLGVALRTSCQFTPYALTGCAEGGLFHVFTHAHI